MANISVLICCANAADTLRDACASVAWADELIIVDSGSSDDTEAIAREFADVYVQEPWRGYGEQKIFGATLARNDWVYILDHDEEVDPALAQAMLDLTEQELARYDVLHARRKNYIYGRHARGWDPDWQTRLIHRERATWNDDVLHDTCLPASPERKRKLPGAILHKRTSSAGFEDYFSGRRLDARLLMVAQQMHDRGKRCSTLDLALRPPFTIFKQLILKGAILDGAFGIMVAQKTAVTTQLKYAALWAIQNKVATPADQ
ncbi:glycosyltransferase family 2 protein [Mucisphaera calidilacus]|uniref:Putative glycosyl transferase n=1 Tax=Mucisphaera calidilacus TaxID=2527982 RepID=A0A518BXP1_9BACT|nr:glycosyltransferase family 2 protein [Mucisphaera calidilacus]QDU71740.1 putative glycosyl transferase [Mucisphaera calidilacus]